MKELIDLAGTKGLFNSKFDSWYLFAVQDFVRNIHKIHVVVIPTVTMNWTYKLINLDNAKIEIPPYSEVNAFDYRSHDEALEYGLKEILNKLP